MGKSKNKAPNDDEGEAKRKKQKVKVDEKNDAEDEVYNIESLKEKSGNKFLVKWENYPEEENTWEPRAAIPGFILKFYDMDLNRLGQPAPPLPSEVKAKKNANEDMVDEKRKPLAMKDKENAPKKEDIDIKEVVKVPK